MMMMMIMMMMMMMMMIMTIIIIKKRKYNSRVTEIEQGTFTPLVFTTTGRMAVESSGVLLDPSLFLDPCP